MADRPILFSGPMVRALLDGRKTQTRRIVKVPGIMGGRYPVFPPEELIELEDGEFRRGIFHYASTGALSGPYKLGFAIGDRLYVREEYYQFGHWEAAEWLLTKGGRQKWAFVGALSMVQLDPPAEFMASRDKEFPGAPRWYKRLGRFMPRSLSRMTLIVTDVRVQRLQDISEADAIAEGVIEYEPTMEDPAEFSAFDGTDVFNNAVSAYRDLWNRINGPGAWDANPWVVAVSFDVVRGNIDAEDQN